MKFIFLILFVSNLSATEPIYYGLYFNFNNNQYSADFKQLDAFNSCCPGYQDGSGTGLSFGASFKYPLDKTSYLGLRLGLNDYSGELSKTENTYVNIPNSGKTLGQFTHYIDASVKAITFEPYYSYKIYNKLYLNGGIQLSYMMTGSHNSVEKITKPTNTGTFWDEEKNESTNSRSRNQTSGDIPNLSAFDIGITFGATYEIQMNKDNTLRLLPELSYRQGITSFVSDNDWKMSNFNIGVNLFYTPKRLEKIHYDDYKIDTIKQKKDYIKDEFIVLGKEKREIIKKESADKIEYITMISRTDTLFTKGKEPIVDYAKDTKLEIFDDVAVKLEINAFDENNKQVKLDKIRLEVELTREIYPLLPTIFFEEKSKDIPVRYQQFRNSSDFNLNDLEPNPIVYNRNTLNIIGERMSENSNANLEITGYIDPTTESDCQLAIERANSIKFYLVNVFNIASDRVKVNNNSSDCVPNDLTRTQTDDGYAENRRVEINSNMPELLFAVTNTKYEEPKKIKPANILFKINADKITSKTAFADNYKAYPKQSKYNYEMLHFWNLNVSQGNNLLLEESGQSQYSELPFEFSRKNATELVSDKNLDISLRGIDEMGKSANDYISIGIVKDTSLVEVEKLTLTVFKVSQATLDNRIKTEIKKFIKNLDENSEIEITGFSDKLGNEIANKNLSAVRAEEVQKYIRSIAPKAKFTKVEGLGSEQFAPGIKSYLTPEERFISRTVEISIKKQR